MKISDLITHLDNVKKHVGDIPVILADTDKRGRAHDIGMISVNRTDMLHGKAVLIAPANKTHVTMEDFANQIKGGLHGNN